MKKLTVVNLVLSVIMIFVVWLPFIRQLNIGNVTADYLIYFLGVVLVISSIIAYVKNKSWVDIVTLVIGFSPVLLLIIMVVGYGLDPRP